MVTKVNLMLFRQLRAQRSYRIYILSTAQLRHRKKGISIKRAYQMRLESEADHKFSKDIGIGFIIVMDNGKAQVRDA